MYFNPTIATSNQIINDKKFLKKFIYYQIKIIKLQKK